MTNPCTSQTCARPKHLPTAQMHSTIMHQQPYTMLTLAVDRQSTGQTRNTHTYEDAQKGCGQGGRQLPGPGHPLMQQMEVDSQQHTSHFLGRSNTMCTQGDSTVNQFLFNFSYNYSPSLLHANQHMLLDDPKACVGVTSTLCTQTLAPPKRAAQLYTPLKRRLTHTPVDDR